MERITSAAGVVSGEGGILRVLTEPGGQTGSHFYPSREHAKMYKALVPATTRHNRLATSLFFRFQPPPGRTFVNLTR